MGNRLRGLTDPNVITQQELEEWSKQLEHPLKPGTPLENLEELVTYMVEKRAEQIAANSLKRKREEEPEVEDKGSTDGTGDQAEVENNEVVDADDCKTCGGSKRPCLEPKEVGPSKNDQVDTLILNSALAKSLLAAAASAAEESETTTNSASQDPISTTPANTGSAQAPKAPTSRIPSSNSAAGGGTPSRTVSTRSMTSDSGSMPEVVSPAVEVEKAATSAKKPTGAGGKKKAK